MLGDPSTKLKLPSYPASSLRSLKAIDWIFEILKSSRLASKVFFLSELIITFLSFRLQYFQEFFQFISGFLQFNREIPDDEKFLHSAAMSQLDPQCLRSLNGYRATAEILELVPDIPNFQIVLRAVKLWAKKNGIYENILGFPVFVDNSGGQDLPDEQGRGTFRAGAQVLPDLVVLVVAGPSLPSPTWASALPRMEPQAESPEQDPFRAACCWL